MNSKIILAFIGGAALASGIVYMAVRPDTKPAAVATVKPTYVDPAQAQPVKADPISTDKDSLKSPVTSEEAVPEKPSPIVPRHQRASRVVHHETAAEKTPTPPSIQVAQVQAPPQPNPTPVVTAPPAQPPAPAPVAPPVAAPEPPKAELPPPPPPTVTIPAGTILSVRIGETLSTKHNQPGDRFMATLEQPLVVDNMVIAERGARCQGRVVESDPGGRVKGVAQLSLELTQVTTSDNQHIRVRTASYERQADTSHKEDAAKIGGGAALGAIIGAIAGGGKGAGIGAAVGGAAGAGDVALTRGKAATIPVETRVSFRLQEPVTITEKQ